MTLYVGSWKQISENRVLIRRASILNTDYLVSFTYKFSLQLYMMVSESLDDKKCFQIAFSYFLTRKTLCIRELKNIFEGYFKSNAHSADTSC